MRFAGPHQPLPAVPLSGGRACMRDRHRHADDMTARGVAGWMGCERCQRGRPVFLTVAAAESISQILKPLEGGKDAHTVD